MQISISHVFIPSRFILFSPYSLFPVPLYSFESVKFTLKVGMERAACCCTECCMSDWTNAWSLICWDVRKLSVATFCIVVKKKMRRLGFFSFLFFSFLDGWRKITVLFWVAWHCGVRRWYPPPLIDWFIYFFCVCFEYNMPENYSHNYPTIRPHCSVWYSAASHVS